MTGAGMKKVYLIGAGPGDPELLTLKAVRALEESDVILYDQLVNPDIIKFVKENVKLVFVGKQKSNHTLPQDEINQLLYEYTKDYETVSRLKGGDPFVFGRGGEEYEYLLTRGVECECIPGITTALGAAASLGMPLTHRDYASGLSLITGHRKEKGFHEAVSKLDLHNKSCVFYMGVTSLAEITSEILRNKIFASIPAMIVENATRENQRVVTGTVATIADIAKEHEISPPAILIFGEAVSFYLRMKELRKATI